MKGKKAASNDTEVKTDIKLLLECMDYQKDNPSAMKQALVTLSSILQANAASKDYFRDSGGLETVLDISTSSRYKEVTDAGLYCLGSGVEGNVFSQKLLTSASTFTFVHGILSAVKESSSIRKRTASFLILCLVSNNSFGQKLARESTCLHDILTLIRISLPKTLSLGMEVSSLELWSTLVSTAGACVNNPLNEENQRICAGLFPYFFSVLQQFTDYRVVRPVLSAVGLIVAGNVPNQERVRKCGGLKLFADILRRFVRASPISQDELTTAVQVVGTLDYVITGNDINAGTVGELGCMDLMIKLLNQAELGDHGKTQIIVTLAHAAEANSKNPGLITADGGMACLIQLLTKASDEELAGAVKYLLHLCVTSEKDPDESMVEEDLVQLEPFLAKLEVMKSRNDSLLLEKINYLDEKLQSMEKKTCKPALTDDRTEATTVQNVTCQGDAATSRCSVPEPRLGGKNNEGQQHVEQILSPREKSLLEQLNKEKSERCRLQKLNHMLHNDILLRDSIPEVSESGDSTGCVTVDAAQTLPVSTVTGSCQLAEPTSHRPSQPSETNLKHLTETSKGVCCSKEIDSPSRSKENYHHRQGIPTLQGNLGHEQCQPQTYELPSRQNVNQQVKGGVQNGSANRYLTRGEAAPLQGHCGSAPSHQRTQVVSHQVNLNARGIQSKTVQDDYTRVGKSEVYSRPTESSMGHQPYNQQAQDLHHIPDRSLNVQGVKHIQASSHKVQPNSGESHLNPATKSLMTPKPLDLSTSSRSHDGFVNSDEVMPQIVQRNRSSNRATPPRLQSQRVDEEDEECRSQASAPVEVDGGQASAVSEISKTVIGGLMDMMKSIQKFTDKFSSSASHDDDTSLLYRKANTDTQQDHNATHLDPESPENIRQGKPSSESDGYGSEEVLQTAENAVIMSDQVLETSQTVSSVSKNQELVEDNHDEDQEMVAACPAENDKEPDSSDLYFLSETVAANKKMRPPMLKERNQLQSKINNFKTNKTKSEDLPISFKNSGENHVTPTKTSNKRMPLTPNKPKTKPGSQILSAEAERTTCRTPTNKTVNLPYKQLDDSGLFVKPLTVAPKRRVRITPLLGSGKMPSFSAIKGTQKDCSGNVRVSPEIDMDQSDAESFTSAVSEFDYHLLRDTRGKQQLPTPNSSRCGVKKTEQWLTRSVTAVATQSPCSGKGGRVTGPRRLAAVPASPFSVKSVGRLKQRELHDSSSRSPVLLAHCTRDGSSSSQGSEGDNGTDSNPDLKRQQIHSKSSRTNNSKCPGCQAPEKLDGQLLDSRTFNIQLETSPYTCQNHRMLRQLERQNMVKTREKLKGRPVTERRLKYKQQSKKTVKRKAEKDSSLYDFQSGSDSGSDTQPVSPGYFTENDTEEEVEIPEVLKHRRRPRMPYTEMEVDNLLAGVRDLGKFWNQILLTYCFHPCRTAMDLQQKFKRLQMQEQSGQTNSKPTSPSGRVYKPFSMCEERRLRRGVKRYGYNWKSVLQAFTFSKGRTSEELRNHWRSLHQKHSPRGKGSKMDKTAA